MGVERFLLYSSILIVPVIQSGQRMRQVVTDAFY